jgi:hypothetical protein
MLQLSETITIYLAIGAPFGVNFFLRDETGKGRSCARSVFKATVAGLLWPFVAIASLPSRKASAKPQAQSDERGSALDEQTSAAIATAERQLFGALERVRELAEEDAAGSEDLEQKIRAVREGIEKYVGLTLALVEMKLDEQPTAREMELCRLAGRSGEDLLLAGRCVHRRNVTRLIAHHARSRTELLHAFATVREIDNERWPVSPTEIAKARHLSVAVLRFYGQAINLLSLLEDESAAMRAARLLDAECSRLRRLEAASLQRDETVGVESKHALHNYTDWPTPAR